MSSERRISRSGQLLTLMKCRISYHKNIRAPDLRSGEIRPTLTTDRDYPYPKKTPHLTTSQNDTSRFPVSFLHLLLPFHSHPSNTPSTDNSIFLHHLLYYLK